MSLNNLFKNSFKTLRANRNRTILTMLGIVIGISAVIIIMSVGAGAQSLILDQITSIGADLVGVTPGHSDKTGPPASVYGITITTLKLTDAKALEKIPEIKYVSPRVEGSAITQYQDEKIDTKIIGTTVSYLNIENAKIDRGNFFEKIDEEGVSKVAVLGWQIAKDFFGEDDPIGKKIKIKKEVFRVVGTFEKRGSQIFQNQDSIVVVPLETAQKMIFGINYLYAIMTKVNNEKDVDYVVAQVKDIMREQHNIDDPQKDDFTVRNTVTALTMLEDITNALKFFLSGIAAISLLVGGVGIMNIMLVSVNERTREIGLRKALGATTNNIKNQFLTESIVVTVLGGVIGIIFGAIFSGLIAIIANYLGYHWVFIVSIPSILMGVGISGFVGILFGWYPARKAANLQPVEALHYE